jgi:hypothetical protein
MQRLRTPILIVLAAALVVLCFRVHHIEGEAHRLKADEMELSSISYGLFNPERWKEEIKSTVAQEIAQYKLDGKDRAMVKEQLERVLTQVFDELRHTVETHDKGLKGALRKAVVKVVIPVQAVKEDIPVYAEHILDAVDKPANREKLKHFALEKLDSLAARTSGAIDMHLYDAIMAKYGFTDVKTGIATLQHERSTKAEVRRYYGWAIMADVLLMLALLLVKPRPLPRDLGILVCSAVVLLVTALLMPMIDIEARISSFEMTILGGPIIFTDQVLFYESRSILQVIWLLLEDHDAALMLVAVLVFCFSVAFPFTKLILSFIALARQRMPASKLYRFFVLKSAKWSMADVLVVAMFMTYLGFNGVVNSQLSDLRDLSSSIHIMTTNKSALEFGFYLFTGFVLLGLVISAFMDREVSELVPPGASEKGE